MLAAVGLLACPGRAPREIAYDLALRLPVAERWSSREVLLFGTPAAEPHQAEGFHREARSAEGDSFLWTKAEAEVSLRFAEVAPRTAVIDLAPYEGVRGQSVAAQLNGTQVAAFALNDARHRYSFSLPAEAQRVGENRLRLVFAQSASPSDRGGSADRRKLAAALYALVVGRQGDPDLADLLRREAPPPFGASRANGVPRIVQTGPSVVRFAIRVPERAELRFTPELHPLARAAAASVILKVTLETRPGQEREVWTRVLDARAAKAEEVAVALPEAGGIARVGLHVVPAAAGGRSAWASWLAPRILGEPAAPTSPAATPDPRGDLVRAAAKGKNVLLIVLDAARADHFSCYGYGRATTPEIDRIAKEGVLFERAYTPAVYTLGAMSSVWTSQPPDRHHAEVSFSARLPKDRLTLAELLTAQGVHTAGFVANTVAGGLNGFDRGFAEFIEVWRTLGSRGDVFRQALPPWLLANKDRRFFAYVHFREPHAPYNPQPPFDTRFGPASPLAETVQKDPIAQSAWVTAVNQGRTPITPGEQEHLVRLYDGNLAYADQEVGALRKALEAAGLWDRTTVVIMADHGEALFEHGWIGHNVQLYEESARVPLILRVPGGPSGVRVAAPVDLLSLAPTLADLFGMAGAGGSDRAFEGRSLLPMIGGAPGPSAVMTRTIWDRPRYARIEGPDKYLYDTRTGEEQLFDLAKDPGERTDLAPRDRLRAAYHREALHDAIARLSRRAEVDAGAAESMTREQCENLKTLGYLSSGVDCSKLR